MLPSSWRKAHTQDNLRLAKFHSLHRVVCCSTVCTFELEVVSLAADIVCVWFDSMFARRKRKPFPARRTKSEEVTWFSNTGVYSTPSEDGTLGTENSHVYWLCRVQNGCLPSQALLESGTLLRLGRNLFEAQVMQKFVEGLFVWFLTIWMLRQRSGDLSAPTLAPEYFNSYSRSPKTITTSTIDTTHTESVTFRKIAITPETASVLSKSHPVIIPDHDYLMATPRL